jgi:hypothetical protein
LYSFPNIAELRGFEGKTLEAVLLGPYTTQFQFESATIVSELAIEQVEPDGIVWRYDNVSWQAGPAMLHRLVNKTVTRLQREDYRLSLLFENGAWLHILSDDDPYEAGQIYMGERMFVF